MRLDLAISQELYLSALGYSPGEIKGAVSRAIGQAERLAKRLPDNIREQAFETFLAQELAECQDWIDRSRRSALESNRHTERYVTGLESLGVKPGPRTVDNYRKSMNARSGQERR